LTAVAGVRGKLDAAAKDRLRFAAAETAAPKLRMALESAASADEAKLADALDAVQAVRR